MLDTKPLLLNTDFPAIARDKTQTLQVNLGYLCNMSCTHCHVNAGPKRTELASKELIDTLLEFIDQAAVTTLDLTGGAPEMNPHFKYFVSEARKRDVTVIDRCNLTIINEPGYEDLIDFFVDNQVVVTASLPCYTEQNVKEQRGNGVFESSITALKKLNERGYGSDPKLPLNLVYNPNGAFLPPAQDKLESDYKTHLRQNFDVEFDQLHTITNMPISRFGSMLLSKNTFEDYLALLKSSFSQHNLDSVMCRSIISVDWQGYVYDCDFNQMLEMPLELHNKNIISSDKNKTHIRDLLNISLEGNPIVIGEHCYGCTAGQGSSCSGALA